MIGGTHEGKWADAKYSKERRGRMGGGVEVKMETFRDEVVKNTATEKKHGF